MIGYGIFYKNNLIRHRVCDIDYLPLVIFKTEEEALDYANNYHTVKKVRISINKKNLNNKYVEGLE